MTGEPTQVDPATQPPPAPGTSKAGIACLVLLIAVAAGIVLLAAIVSQ